MRRRRWQVALLGPFLLFGLPIAAQECKNTQSHIVEGHKAKHRSAIDDIETIGSRSMGTRGFGNWYSLEQEIDMGRDYSRKIESSSKLLKDPVVTEYVNRIAQNIVRNSDAKVPFTIKVIDSEEVNAFALPGGFMYVNNGLILYAQGEAELAAVMAHEIAHVAAHHASRQMTRSQLLNLGTIPLVFLGGGAGLAVQQAVGLMIPMSLTKFSRGFEMEADYLGVEYLYKAGYDPQAFIVRLAEIVCHDNFTEMHAFKHHQSIVEEYHATREPWRWMHLVCGAQAAAISFGKNMTVYEEDLELLHAA